MDLVNIAELQALDLRTKGAFTQREREEVEKAIDKWSYLAGRLFDCLCDCQTFEIIREPIDFYDLNFYNSIADRADKERERAQRRTAGITRIS